MQSPAVSIFNDVLGPIMTGPSSSHTAGPWRIGYFIHHLMPQFSAVRILFPQKGSYAGVYKGQKSDIALVAGLLGMEVTDPDFRHSLVRLKEKGITLSIEIVDMPLDHPNLSVVELADAASGRRLSVSSWSVGGGMFAVRSPQRPRPELRRRRPRAPFPCARRRGRTSGRADAAAGGA